MRQWIWDSKGEQRKDLRAVLYDDTSPALAAGRLTSTASKPTGSGTGLGLTLAYDIVTQGHGGMMAVKSESGATYVITLPS